MNFDAIMRAIAAAPGAANNQANVLEDQAQGANAGIVCPATSERTTCVPNP